MTQAFNLSQLANNLDSSGRLDATDGLVNAVPVANGGTGASSVAAAVSNLSESIYPVGSVYINAAVNTNPATLLGFGTWVAFGAGRVMVGLDASDAAFDTLQEVGGSKNATLVSHNHTFSGTTSGQSNDHSHPLQTTGGGGADPFVSVLRRDITDGYAYGTAGNVVGGVSADHSHTYSGTTSTSGSSATNANLQPYITVCMWLRTA